MGHLLNLFFGFFSRGPGGGGVYATNCSKLQVVKKKGSGVLETFVLKYLSIGSACMISISISLPPL